MDTLSFELPRQLWKVTKKYGTLGVPSENMEKVIENFETLFFQYEDLAMDYFQGFKLGDEEFIQITDDWGFTLPVYATIEKVNTIDYIPKVLDF
jgi:hypothetical protein